MIFRYFNFIRGNVNQNESDSIESFIEFGNKIAEELHSDPLCSLIQADRLYRAMLNKDYEEDAAKFRENIKNIIEEMDVETLEKWKTGGFERKVPHRFAVIDGIEPFDESVFEIPYNETAKFYRDRHDELEKIYEDIRSMALTGNRKRELKAKAAIALSLASMRLDKMGRSFKSEPTCDFEKVQNSDLPTPRTPR